MRPCMIFNPTARGEKARRHRKFFDSLATGCDLKPTTGPGTARELARRAIEEGHEIVIAAGGDGTVFEVLNGLGDARDGFQRAALAVLPVGTANVFAHELDLPIDPTLAWQAILQGRTRWIDLPEAHYQCDGRTAHSYFCSVAGAGLDARAVQRVNWGLKKNVGKLAYILASLQALSEPGGLVECRFDGREVRGRGVVVSNGRFYAGRVPLFPDGRLDSGRLHLCVVERVTPAVLAAGLLAYVSGRWFRPNSVHNSSGTHFRLDSAQPAPLQLDGEAVGQLPATVRVAPRRLRVVVP